VSRGLISSTKGFHQELAKFSHSPGCSGKGYYGSAKPSGGEDLDIEEPSRVLVLVHLPPPRHTARHAGPPLIRHQVVQVSQAREKRLLATTWVMKAFHGEQLPLVPVLWQAKALLGARDLLQQDRDGARRPPAFPWALGGSRRQAECPGLGPQRKGQKQGRPMGGILTAGGAAEVAIA
jgi:hypothetical protein